MQLQKMNHLQSLKGQFQNRGYPKTLVGNQLKCVTETRQTSDQTYKRGNGVLLVFTYQPQLKNVNDIIKKHLVFLYAKGRVENIFTPPPFASFQRGFSLRKHWLGLKYTFFYVNVDHLVVTKVDVRPALKLAFTIFKRQIYFFVISNEIH